MKSRYQIFLLLPKVSLCPIVSLPLPCPHQPQICFLSLQVSVHFLELCINGITQHILFLVRPLSFNCIVFLGSPWRYFPVPTPEIAPCTKKIMVWQDTKWTLGFVYNLFLRCSRNYSHPTLLANRSMVFLLETALILIVCSYSVIEFPRT